MATYSSTLAWKIPWMEAPGRLQSMGSQRVGHNWTTSQVCSPFQHLFSPQISYPPPLLNSRWSTVFYSTEKTETIRRTLPQDPHLMRPPRYTVSPVIGLTVHALISFQPHLCTQSHPLWSIDRPCFSNIFLSPSHSASSHQFSLYIRAISSTNKHTAISPIFKKKNSSDSTSPSSYHFISLLSFIVSKLFKRCVYTHCFQFLFSPLLWKFFNQHVTPTPPLKPLVETAKNLHIAILKSFHSTALDMIGQILLCFLHLVFRILHSPDFSLTPWHFHLKIK